LCVKTSAPWFNNAKEALNEFCLELYGIEPVNINADEIIDTVLSDSSFATGMRKAEDFDNIMNKYKKAEINNNNVDSSYTSYKKGF
jgi:sialic acid synthase SpsE